LGFFNGMFAVSAIGSMMALAGQGREAREGTRMGLWGAAQAVAAGLGGVLGSGAVDLARHLVATPTAFGLVFLAEAGLFVVATLMAQQIIEGRPEPDFQRYVPGE
jgi:BCD family chlorophyll transporter-like MFS transporter